MSQRDFYDILGVANNASDKEIKKSYQRLAMKYHPDRNPNNKSAEEKFKEINRANEILSDPEKRAAYDQYGHAGVDPNRAGANGSTSGFTETFADLGDIFNTFFGGGKSSAGQQVCRGADLGCNLDITLEQAACGCCSTITVPSWDICDSCRGSGAKAGTQLKACSTCSGHGQVRMQQGFFSIQQTCPKCQGNGKIITDPCFACSGVGRIKRKKTLEVTIPAGIDEGRIRLAGKGEPGRDGGSPGDLYVEVHLKPHPVFQREGDNLHCEMPISFSKATLGGEIEVPTLTGKVSVTLPEGTQTGKVFRLKGKGIKGYRSGKPGDLFCHVVVEIPVKLSDRQKELLCEFEKLTTQDDHHSCTHCPQTKTWMDKVKAFFEK